jgi:hypothetical protein
MSLFLESAPEDLKVSVWHDIHSLPTHKADARVLRTVEESIWWHQIQCNHCTL